MTRQDYISSTAVLASAAHVHYFHDKMPVICTLGLPLCILHLTLTIFSTFWKD